MSFQRSYLIILILIVASPSLLGFSNPPQPNKNNGFDCLHPEPTKVNAAKVVPSSRTYSALLMGRNDPTKRKGNLDASSLYSILASSRPEMDSNPGNDNFFYNDEVCSHLHGYMLLVGLFAARDQAFVFSFAVLAALAAGATLRGALPANPRVPGMVAATTMLTTVMIRYYIHSFSFPDDEIVESGWRWEALIVALNVLWGFFGSWRTKEPINGATYGF